MYTPPHKYLDPNNALGKLYLSIEMSVLVFLCFMVGLLLTPGKGDLLVISGLWCAISGIIVLQDSHKKTKHAALIRVLGSLLGAAIGGLFLTFFSAQLWILIPMIFVVTLLSKLLRFEEGMRLSVLTAAIVFAVSYIGPDTPGYLNAIYRFIESAVGSGIALLIRWGSLLLLTKLPK